MPSQLPADPLIIDRYAIYAAVASGGMATVHLARLHGPAGFSRTVAAKRLHRHLASDPDFSGMLIDEARVAARIRHPNVVSTVDVVATRDELIVVMEYVHGESVAKLAREVHDKGGLIDRRIVGAILIDALHGLHAAHEAIDERGKPLGIVHRDVSPHNLLVGVDGITRIADFGIAKAAGRLHVTRDQSIKGKLAYMAPEQIQDGSVTRATDVFAASIVLWELLTGRALFAGATDGQTVFNVLQSKIPPARELVNDVPPALDAILERGLSRDPNSRFQSAREMAIELERCTEPIRPSEIGSWVQQVAGEGLAERTRMIAEVEGHHPRSEAMPAHVVASSSREDSGKADAGAKQTRRIQISAGATPSAVAPPPTGPAPPGVATGAAPSPAGGPPTAPFAGGDRASAPSPRFESSQVDVHVRDHDESTPRPRRYRRWVQIGATVAVAGALVLLSRQWPAQPRVSVVSPVPPVPTETATRPPALLTAVPAGSSASQDDPPATSATPPSPAPASSPTKAGRGAGGSANRSGHRKSSPQCNPPYTIDSSGRRLFKLECM